MYKNRKMGVEFFNKLISDPYRIMKEEVEVKPKKPWYGFIGFVKFCKLIFTQLYKLFAKCSVKVTNLIVCLFKHPFGVLKFLAKNLLFLTMVVFLLFVLIIQLFREYGGEPEDSMTYCSKVLKNTLGSRFEFISVVSGLYCAVTFIYVIYCLLCLI